MNSQTIISLSDNYTILFINAYKKKDKTNNIYYELIHGDHTGDGVDFFDDILDLFKNIYNLLKDYYDELLDKINNNDKFGNRFEFHNITKKNINEYILIGYYDNIPSNKFISFMKKYNYLVLPVSINNITYFTVIPDVIFYRYKSIFGKKQSNMEFKCYNLIKDYYNDLVLQYKCPNTNYVCDFYSKNKNTIIEFLGDYYHGNLEIYNKDDINPTLKESYKNINDSTFQRLSYIKSLGYNVGYIWEHKFKKLKKKDNINEIISFI